MAPVDMWSTEAAAVAAKAAALAAEAAAVAAAERPVLQIPLTPTRLRPPFSVWLCPWIRDPWDSGRRKWNGNLYVTGLTAIFSIYWPVLQKFSCSWSARFAYCGALMIQ